MGEGLPDWRSALRIKLREIAARNSSGRFDCGVNEVVRAIDPNQAQEINAAGFMRSFVPSTATPTRDPVGEQGPRQALSMTLDEEFTDAAVRIREAFRQGLIW